MKQQCLNHPEDIDNNLYKWRKKHKLNILRINMNSEWPKQEQSMNCNATDTGLENLDKWRY